MLRFILFIILVILLLYLGIATLFLDFHFVGKWGKVFGEFNRKYFGLLGYLYPFLLIWPLYRFFKRPFYDKKLAQKSLSIALFTFALVIFQALVVPEPYSGYFGKMIVQALIPYIGIAGIWLLFLLLVGIGTVTYGIDWMANFLQRSSFKKESITIFENSASHQQIPLQKEKKPVKKEQEKPRQKEEKKNEEQKPTSIKVIKNELPLVDDAAKDGKVVKKAKKGAAAKEKRSDIKIVNELEENRRLLESIDKGEMQKPTDFRLPSINFLQKAPTKREEVNEAEIDKKVKELIEKLKRFKIEGDVVRTYTGPLVTTFEFKPAPHIKVSKVLNLADDLAMALKARTIRIQAPIPGKDVIGIEIPNKNFETIYLREIIESELFKKAASPLTLALGKDIVGKPFITDLKKLPHLLIAGTTGSGKSVGINAMVMSLLYRNSPDNLKLMMIDPKMLEFSIYNDIPHLLTPVITSSKQAVVALNNMVTEMERRYKLMSQLKTKNIEGYNKKASKEGMQVLPYIVVIIDELADLMMTSGKEVEYSIARLAQMARAAGIHLIVATQRPSVDVVTGLIKANLPARISFRVGQKIDSKVILDSIGAESLLGRGDMLFTPPGAVGLIRLHAPWVSEGEIEKVVEYLKSQREPEYDEKFLAETLGGGGESGESSTQDLDELYEEAKKIVLSEKKTSISYLQRRLQIGYNRAARIVEQLENMGVLSAPNAKGNREILL